VETKTDSWRFALIISVEGFISVGSSTCIPFGMNATNSFFIILCKQAKSKIIPKWIEQRAKRAAARLTVVITFCNIH
jgi:hypothetical protein